MQAPTGPPLSSYTIYIMVMGTTSERTILGTSTTWNYTEPQPNTVYQFTVQAINNGGAGPMSNVVKGFFCDGKSYHHLS